MAVDLQIGLNKETSMPEVYTIRHLVVHDTRPPPEEPSPKKRRTIKPFLAEDPWQVVAGVVVDAAFPSSRPTPAQCIPPEEWPVGGNLYFPNVYGSLETVHVILIDALINNAVF